jgi:hypothetical protein
MSEQAWSENGNPPTATHQVGLGVATVVAQHKLFDEIEEQVLKFCLIVAAIDDKALGLFVHLHLSTQLATEELGRVWRQSKYTLPLNINGFMKHTS